MIETFSFLFNLNRRLDGRASATTTRRREGERGSWMGGTGRREGVDRGLGSGEVSAGQQHNRGSAQ